MRRAGLEPQHDTTAGLEIRTVDLEVQRRRVRVAEAPLWRTTLVTRSATTSIMHNWIATFVAPRPVHGPTGTGPQGHKKACAQLPICVYSELIITTAQHA